MIFSSKFTNPTGIFCKDGGSELESSFNPIPVKCFADISLPITEPETSGLRYIAVNVSSPDPSWTNLPIGLEEGDIIEREGLDWVIKTNISEIGAGVLVYVICRSYYYWYSGLEWKEINPDPRFEYTLLSSDSEILDSLDVLEFNAVQWNIAISYLDGTKRIFQSIFSTHENKVTPFHTISNRTGSSISNFNYDIDVNIALGKLNLVIQNNSLIDYKIQVKRIPIENYNE